MDELSASADDIGGVSELGEGTVRVENLATGGYWELVMEEGEWRVQLFR